MNTHTNNNVSKWTLDPSHSELTFKVKHLMISNVKGEFKTFSANVDVVDETQANITAAVDTASVFTNNTDRDEHLKGSDFFDSEKFPAMSFASVSVKRLDDDAFKVKGLLTIKGISKEVILDVEFGGINKDPWGNEKAGFSFTTKINRSEWGLNWNAALETGGVLVSDEVKISGDIQFVKQA